MAIQRWTIVKIGGAAAKPVRSKFKRWHGKSLAIERKNTKWHKAEIVRMQRLVTDIRAHRMELPLLFFSEHVDMWSVGSSLLQYLPKTSETWVVSAEFLMACVELPVPETYLKNLALRLRKRDRCQEDKWFLSQLQHAVRAWEKLVPEGVVILIREVTGPSALDAEVVDACKSPHKWLA